MKCRSGCALRRFLFERGFVVTQPVIFRRVVGGLGGRERLVEAHFNVFTIA